MSTSVQTFSFFVAGILRKKNMRASHLAAKIGVSHATVGRWLKGEDVPCAKSCYKVAEFTDVPVEDVLRAAGHIPIGKYRQSIR